MSRREGTEPGCKPLGREPVHWVNRQKKQKLLNDIEKIDQIFETATDDELKGKRAAYKRRKARHKSQLQEVENNGERDRGGLERAKVPGGWLVRQYHSPGLDYGGAASMTFVPDPRYEWK